MYTNTNVNLVDGNMPNQNRLATFLYVTPFHNEIKSYKTKLTKFIEIELRINRSIA